MLQKNGVRFGLYAGLGAVAYSLLLYIVDAKLIFGGFASASWVIYLFCMFQAANLDKKELGGYLTFKEGFQATFAVFAIASLLQIAFQFLLLTVIDPSLVQMQTDVAIEAMEKMAGMFGLSEADMETAIAEIEKNSKPSIGQSTQAYLINLIIGAIPAAIIAAILKKNRPFDAPITEEKDDSEHLVS
jgi:hypothetical protein